MTAHSPVASEHSQSNVAGTIAMALQGSPANINSGTDEFFFNLVDNNASGTTNLDSQNFTVFGHVADGSSMRVLNTFATFPTQNQAGTNGALTDLPLHDYTGSNFPADTTAANFALVNLVNTVRPSVGESGFTYAVSGFDSSVLTATVTN